jgi:flagellar hook-associated protein 2
MSISSPGIGSGLDINSIVSQLMAIERQPITNLGNQQTKYQARLSAYGKIKSALDTFQTAAQALSTPGKYKVFTGSVTDESIATVTAGSSASPASYQIETTQLAQQHKIGSSAYSSLYDTIGTGSLTIEFGTFDGTAGTFTQNGGKPVTTINIDASNNTLSGVRDAINTADADVSASIINDGTGYRLVITSKDSGAANSIKVAVSDGDGNNSDAIGLSALAYDPVAATGTGKNLTQFSEARNALFTIDGISISKANNTVTDAIQGVTLKLTKTNEGLPATLTVDQDTKSITESVQAFVTAYNDANKVLRDLTAYNAQSKTGAALTGDSTVRSIGLQLRSILTGSLSTPLTSLSQVGISFQSNGTLALDTTKFEAAVSTKLNDVASLFAISGTIADNQIKLVGSTSKTQVGSYAIDITSVATRGQVTGSQTAGLVITAGVNDQLTLEVNGVSVNATLTPGTYSSASTLAAEVQAKINNTTGASVAVHDSSGVLSITSNSFGSNSNITVTGGNGATSLLGASPTSQAGQDVSGMINGLTATGHGQTLTAGVGSPAEGLSILVTGGSTGPRGSLAYAEGIAKQLDRYIDEALGANGRLTTRTDGINSSIRKLTDRQADLESRMSQIEKRYRAQFSALDAMLSSMSTTSTFLTQQLAAMNNSNSNN